MRKLFGFVAVMALVCGTVVAQENAQPSPSDVSATAQTVVEPTPIAAEPSVVDSTSTNTSGAIIGAEPMMSAPIMQDAYAPVEGAYAPVAEGYGSVVGGCGCSAPVVATPSCGCSAPVVETPSCGCSAPVVATPSCGCSTPSYAAPTCGCAPQTGCCCNTGVRSHRVRVLGRVGRRGC